MPYSAANEDEFLRIARERFQRACDADADIRRDANRDLKFLTGEQWEEGEQEARRKAGRPALTMNKLPPFVDQIVNEQRKARPAGKISPVGDGADAKTADIYQGLVRHIEYVSQADAAYDTGFDYAVSSSFGFWRYTTECPDDRSLDQEINITRVADPATVRFDPAAQEVDYSDAMWAFVVERISKEEFKLRYPKSKTTTSSFFEFAENPAPSWLNGEDVQIAEYWVVEISQEQLYIYRGPQANAGPNSDTRLKGFFDGETIPPGFVPEPDADGAHAGRLVDRRKVCRYDINGAEVLKQPNGKAEVPWAGKWIPIVPVLGKEKYVEGKRVLMSAIRFALDPQQLYNFYKTGEAEVVQQTPKSPYIGVLGQFKTMSAKWGTANVIPHAYLEYDPVAVGGVAVSAPQRQPYEPATQALAIGAAAANEDIKGTIGLYDASRGKENSAADSGKAIALLQGQGDNATYHFFDNFMRSMWHGYRILVDLIPRIYDAPRVVRIVKPDDTTELVQINQMFMGEDGKPTHYDFSAGRYDVVMSIQPSFASRKQQASVALGDLAKADPQSLPQWADLYVKTLDLGVIGDEIADRLVPPAFKKQDGQNDPQQLQQAMQALQQKGQEQDQLIQQQHQIIETKQAEQEARIQIAQMQEETKRLIAQNSDAVRLSIAEITAKAQDLARQSADALASMRAHEAMAHDVATQAQDHANSMQQADQSAAHASDASAQNAAQTSDAAATAASAQAAPEGGAA